MDVVSSQVRSVNFETDNALGSSNSRALLGSDTAGDDTNRGSNPNDADAADSSRFEVNLSKMTVKSDAGATVRDVLDFLENHRRGDGDGDDDDDELLKQESSDETQSLDVLRSLRDKDVSSDGYTLPAFPWFVDQTIGGAVATATHGSSLRHGSLSSQVRVYGLSPNPETAVWTRFDYSLFTHTSHTHCSARLRVTVYVYSIGLLRIVLKTDPLLFVYKRSSPR